jgi:hypothetical protein
MAREKRVDTDTNTRGKFLAAIERFLKQNPDITPEHFGWLTIGDTSLVPRLREGGDVTTRKLDLVTEYLIKCSTQKKETTHGSQEVRQKEAR